MGLVFLLLGCDTPPAASIDPLYSQSYSPDYTRGYTQTYAQPSAGSPGGLRAASAIVSAPDASPDTNSRGAWAASDFFGGDPELDVGPPEVDTYWGMILAETVPIACPGSACPTAQWRSVIQQGRSLPLRDRVLMVNRFVLQQVAYREDVEHQQGEDDWKTPVETAELGYGDCEDFAVAQYYLLRAMGTPPDFLRLVRTEEPGALDHIALAVSFAERIVVMDYDGLWGPERYGALIASMNENRVWAHADPFNRDNAEARSVAGYDGAR